MLLVFGLGAIAWGINGWYVKDTTLVSIIGLYDMLLMMRAAGRTPQWIGLHKETLFFGAVIYFVFCFAMSRYSMALERKLHTGH